MSQNCKHVTATLLAYIEFRKRSAELGVREEVAQWLTNFRAKVESTKIVKTETAGTKRSATYQIAYVLTFGAFDADLYELVTFKARLGVGGGVRAIENWYPSYACNSRTRSAIWTKPCAPRCRRKCVTPSRNRVSRAATS